VKLILNTIFLLIFFSYPFTSIKSKDKFNPNEVNKINRNYLFRDCKEKKSCYESCNNIPNYGLIFSIFTTSVDPNLSKTIKSSCLSDCSRIVCSEE